MKSTTKIARTSSRRIDPAPGINPVPIIIGCPRSGTTLLRFMLDSHPELAIPPETGFFLDDRIRSRKDNILLEDFFRAIVTYPKESPAWPDFEIHEDLFWSSLKQIHPFNLTEGYRTFYRLYAARFDKPRWGDKTPIYCGHLEAIREVLPEALFIHVIRDGRDAALSLRKMWFSPGPEIETLAAYWRECVLAARRAGVNCPDYIEVRYEELILNTRETLYGICKFIDLDYDDKMLHYYTRSAARLTEQKGRSLSDGTQLLTKAERFRQQERTTLPPDPACVFAWKQAMSSEEQIRFQLTAGSLLRDLSYEV